MNLTEIYDVIGQVLVAEIQAQLVRGNGLKKSGGLVASISHEVDSGGLEILANDYYGYYIEGRRPYTKKVPISALIKWIKRYRIKGRSKKGRFISDLSLAFAIQNSIYKKGIKKKIDVVDYVLKKNNSIINEIIDKEFMEWISSELDPIFND